MTMKYLLFIVSVCMCACACACAKRKRDYVFNQWVESIQKYK